MTASNNASKKKGKRRFGEGEKKNVKFKTKIEK